MEAKGYLRRWAAWYSLRTRLATSAIIFLTHESSGDAVMCRPSMPLLPCLFGVLLLGVPAAGRAQLAVPQDEFDSKNSVKELAKDLFESTQATTRDLAQARLEAARTQLRERYEKYRYGQLDGTLDLLLESAAFLAKAELGALEKPTPEERLKPLVAHWLHTLSAEQIVEAKYRIGGVSRANLMQARYDRLDAEIKLREAGQKLSEPF
jgi:hypothetical protein